MRGGGSVTRSIPPSAVLKRSAQNAAYRARKKTHAAWESGDCANYNHLEELAIPPHITRRRDGNECLLYDSGAGAGRILLLGTQANVRAPQSATVWGCDWDFKVYPKLWAKLYTVRAVVDGYCLPRIYARLPGKSQDAYTTMRDPIRNLAGEDPDKGGLVTMDFARTSITAVEATPPQRRGGRMLLPFRAVRIQTRPWPRSGG